MLGAKCTPAHNRDMPQLLAACFSELNFNVIVSCKGDPGSVPGENVAKYDGSVPFFPITSCNASSK